MEIQSLPPTVTRPAPIAGQPARQLEQAFMEQMLKYAFPKPEAGAFSGGAGEEQFSSFLTREYAALLSERLDLGFGDAFAETKA